MAPFPYDSLRTFDQIARSILIDNLRGARGPGVRVDALVCRARMLSLSLSYSAQAPVSSDKNKDLTIKVRDGCFFTVPVSELIEYANVGALLTTILELAAKEGQAVTDPERAEDCSILLNGDKELITAKTAFESRLIDRIRRRVGWPADLLPPDSTRSRAKGALVAAPHWDGEERSVKIFSPISQRFVPPLKAGQETVKVKGTDVTLGFYHEKSVHLFEVEMYIEGLGVKQWTPAHLQPPEIGVDAPTRLTVAGLEPETRYRFRVRACTETAKSLWTETAKSLPVLTGKHVEKETPLPKRQRKAKVDSPHAARAHAEVPQPATGPSKSKGTFVRSSAAGHSAGSSTATPSDGGLQSVRAMLNAAGLTHAALEDVSQKLDANGFDSLDFLKKLEKNGSLENIMMKIGVKLGHYHQMALALK